MNTEFPTPEVLSPVQPGPEYFTDADAAELAGGDGMEPTGQEIGEVEFDQDAGSGEELDDDPPTCPELETGGDESARDMFDLSNTELTNGEDEPA